MHPSGPSETDSATAIAAANHHHQTRMRTRHTLIKKLTRGRLLFLGLDGAGKSTIVHHLIRSLDEECTSIQSTSTIGDMVGGGDEPRGGSRVYPNPSKALQSWSYRLEGDCYLQVLDVPGKREFRRKWYTSALSPSDSNSTTHYASGSGAGGAISLQAIPLLGVVFVVDASDRVRFPVVAEELIRYQKLKEQKKTFQRAQFFLLLNKTDQTTATSIASQDDVQKQVNDNRRVAMRVARRELKKCVDHHMRMDQKRNPQDYRSSSSSHHHVTSVAPPSSAGSPEASSGVPPDMKSPKALAGGANRSAPFSTVDASASRTTAMMTSILECNAHDRESIKAIHAWIKDEIKKVM